ncbi:unnamed protein product, partial [Brassica oleracea var. botrytis]
DANGKIEEQTLTTKEVWKLQNGRVIVHFDDDCSQPDEDCGGLLGSWLGQLSNDVNLLPIDYADWKVFAPHRKDKAWDIILLGGQFSGIGWVWKDDRGKIQLMGTRNLRRREKSLHSELEALRWAMESMLQHSTCQRFGTDCKDLIAMVVDPQAWPNFSTELEVIQLLKMCFSDLKIEYFPRVQNRIVDSLARNARSFHRSLCFVGCSILVSLPRPPQV